MVIVICTNIGIRFSSSICITLGFIFFLAYFPFIVFLSRHFIDNGIRLVHFRHVVLLNFITRVALIYFSVQIIACIIFDWQTKRDANGTTEPDANVSTNTGSSHYEDIQLPDEEVK
jgi:hypothetical protein